MYMITINGDKCEGCGECVDSCAQELLALDDDGKAEVVGDLTECLGCESCVELCEHQAVSLQEL